MKLEKAKKKKKKFGPRVTAEHTDINQPFPYLMAELLF